ncbi:MAG: ABC transporter permease, partial [Giesbergeria sp.]
MNLQTALRAALRALTANLLRSVLTMLGIIIGVAAVITMLAVGRGATERVQEQIKGLGSNIVLVVPGSLSAAGVRLGAQTRSRFTEEDAEALAREVPEVQVAAPSSRTTAQAVAQSANWNTTIFGTTNDYLEAREWPLASGRLFEAAEQQGSAKVAWLGQTVRVRGVPFTVVGVLAAKGQNAVGQDQDDIVIMPMSTFRNRIWNAGGNVRRIWSIHVKVRAGVDMARAEESMRAFLRQRLRVPEGGDDTFSIRNLSEVLQAQEESSRVMTALLAAVAGVSLLVGGIGIMNIMLVSVTE